MLLAYLQIKTPMFYKLSNTADLIEIEGDFDAIFKYPLLFRPSPIINGLSEQVLPVITMDNQKQIDFAIWGMLPQNYAEGWDTFQNLSNTLNISLKNINNMEWAKNLMPQQRCVIVVSGFFTSYVYNGEVYPFYVYDKHHRPFALAGVYSTLVDGFLSVSLVTSTSKTELKHIHNLGLDFPIAMSKDDYKDWFHLDLNQPDFGIGNIKTLELKAHTISKEFYKNDIIYDSILDPADYGGLPVLTLK